LLVTDKEHSLDFRADVVPARPALIPIEYGQFPI